MPCAVRLVSWHDCRERPCRFDTFCAGLIKPSLGTFPVGIGDCAFKNQSEPLCVPIGIDGDADKFDKHGKNEYVILIKDSYRFSARLCPFRLLMHHQNRYCFESLGNPFLCITFTN